MYRRETTIESPYIGAIEIRSLQKQLETAFSQNSPRPILVTKPMIGTQAQFLVANLLYWIVANISCEVQFSEAWYGLNRNFAGPIQPERNSYFLV